MPSFTDDQKWTLRLLQNANFSPDTRNSVTFQLTASATMRKGEAGKSSILVRASDIQWIAHAFTKCEGSDEIQDCKVFLGEIAGHVKELATRAEDVVDDDAPVIMFSEKIGTLKQLKVAYKTRKMSHTLMERKGNDYDTGQIKKKNKLEDIKLHTKCLACGRTGHWFRENERCVALMRDKLASAQRKKSTEDRHISRWMTSSTKETDRFFTDGIRQSP